LTIEYCLLYIVTIEKGTLRYGHSGLLRDREWESRNDYHYNYAKEKIRQKAESKISELAGLFELVIQGDMEREIEGGLIWTNVMMLLKYALMGMS
jgi:hypothetical protein